MNNQALKLIPKAQTVGVSKVTVSRERAEFKANMVMTRFYVDTVLNDGDRERAEYIYSQLMEQCKKLARNFGFTSA